MRKKRRPRKLKRHSHPLYGLFATGLVMSIAIVFVSLRPTTGESKTVETPIKIAQDHDMVLIPTPTRAIAQGERLEAVEFTMMKWPKSRLMGSYMTNLSDYKEGIALTSLPKYLPIPLSAISTQPLDANAVVEGIPKGMRAITVRVDAESAVEGWARSGNFVDVIVIRVSKTSDMGLNAKVIAENVKILSAGRSTKPGKNSHRPPKTPSTITLLVTQEEALKIKTAASIGKLTFALRGRGDKQPTLSRRMNRWGLLEESPSALQKKVNNFQGYAKAPNGNIYVLEENSHWIRTTEIPKTLAFGKQKMKKESTPRADAK